MILVWQDEPLDSNYQASLIHCPHWHRDAGLKFTDQSMSLDFTALCNLAKDYIPSLTIATYCNNIQFVPNNSKTNFIKKALVIAVNPTIRSISKFVLSDYMKCTIMRSSPEGKLFLKSSDQIRVLILDWSIQDKYGSVLKCLKEAKARKNVLVVNVFISEEQKKYVQNLLPNMAHNNKIYSVVSDFLEFSLMIALYKLKNRIERKLNEKK